jgi:hypothetical protein
MTSPLHPDLLQPGDTVWHYRVVRRLSSGGFSTVLLVEHAGYIQGPKGSFQPRRYTRSPPNEVTTRAFSNRGEPLVRSPEARRANGSDCRTRWLRAA